MTSVSEAFAALVTTMDNRTPHLDVIIAAGEALAREIDDALCPDANGKTKAASAAVRELRAVCDELVLKGRTDVDSDEGDWTAPGADSSPVRLVPQSGAGDVRARGNRGGKAAG